MSLDKVREYFNRYGIADKILIFDDSSATVELAAQCLHTAPGRIAKTLSFMVDSQPVLIVMEGTARIDNHKFKQFFHKKAKMMSAEELSRYIGHDVGGVCPFGLPAGVDVYLDRSLRKYETVFPAAGSSNSAIELTPEELEKYSGSKGWADLTKENP